MTDVPLGVPINLNPPEAIELVVLSELGTKIDESKSKIAAAPPNEPSVPEEPAVPAEPALPADPAEPEEPDDP